VEFQGVQANVEDGGGVDIGEHHGMEGVGEEDDKEDEGCGGQDDGGGDVRHRRRSKRQTNNPIEGLQPNCTDDLHADDDESEGTFVHDRGLSDTELESEELDNMDEFEDGEEDINTGGKFPSFEMPKNMADFLWYLGNYFTDKETFKDAIITYAIHSGRNLKLVKK